MFTSFKLSDNTVGYIVHGDMGSKGMRIMQKEIITLMEYHGVINLYLEDANIDYFSLGTILTGTRFPHKYHKNLNKVAMVTNRKWIHLLSAMNNKILNANYKNFTIDKRMDAMDWLAGEE